MEVDSLLGKRKTEKFDRYLGEYIYKNKEGDRYLNICSMATTKYPRQGHL